MAKWWRRAHNSLSSSLILWIRTWWRWNHIWTKPHGPRWVSQTSAFTTRAHNAWPGVCNWGKICYMDKDQVYTTEQKEGSRRFPECVFGDVHLLCWALAHNQNAQVHHWVQEDQKFMAVNEPRKTHVTYYWSSNRNVASVKEIIY